MLSDHLHTANEHRLLFCGGLGDCMTTFWKNLSWRKGIFTPLSLSPILNSFLPTAHESTFKVTQPVFLPKLLSLAQESQQPHFKTKVPYIYSFQSVN